MAQCKKMLADGERCSNRAVPGVDYCEQHRSVQLRPAADAPAQTGEAAETSTSTSNQPKETATWTIRPSADGETPTFPGLRADARNILVAPHGIIWLHEQESTGRTNPLNQRLSRLLGCLSHEFALAGNITIHQAREGFEALVKVRPPVPDTADLSRFYDAVAAAAALSDGPLYVGQERAFIRYRDGGAARGYDADDVRLPEGDELYLLDQEMTHRVSPHALTEVSLPDLLLEICPLPAREVELPSRAFALVAMPLYRMAARYLRDHHLGYRIARFHTPQGETLALFEIIPHRATTPTGAHVPAFVLNHFENLPRAVVLTEVWADAEGRRMLVQWGRRYPGYPRHVLPAFPPDSLLVFNSDSDYANLSVIPSPVFFEGDDVTSAQMPRSALAELRPLNNQTSLPFNLPLRLVRDSGATPQTSALILDEEETRWVRRLLYRLPGDAFGSYTLCMGETRSVLLGERMPVESLPFGIPLQRVEDTQLFIPLRTRFAPDLPWALLAQTLSLKDGVYTFLAEDFRLDIPRAAFAPLSRALVAGEKPQPEEFTLVKAQRWPDLKWKPRTQPVQPERAAQTAPPTSPHTEPAGQSFFERSREERTSEQHVIRENPQGGEPSQPPDEAALFRRRAEIFLYSRDHLGAAFCFALAGDNYNAARSFQEAARRIKERETERGRDTGARPDA
jgi:hypothetical protein